MVKHEYPFNLVEVLWEDAESSVGWEGAEETNHDPAMVLTVGFLIHQTDNILHIASTTDKERNTNARLKIPAGMVRSMKVLKAATKRKKSG
jgi:hypothetical protein